MGNSSCKRRKKKTENDNDNDHQRETTAGTQAEDVLYADIDHTNINPDRGNRELEDNSCDYADVMLPQKTTDMVKHKSTEDCSDDYVLMG